MGAGAGSRSKGSRSKGSRSKGSRSKGSTREQEHEEQERRSARSRSAGARGAGAGAQEQEQRSMSAGARGAGAGAQEQEQRSMRSAMRARNRGLYYVSSCALSSRASSTAMQFFLCQVISLIESPQMTINKLPPKVPGSRDSSKVLLRNFKDMALKSLAKAGQLHFCRYVSVVEAFLYSNEKESLCWGCLEMAAKTSDEMNAMLRTIEGDTETTRDLINYVPFVFY